MFWRLKFVNYVDLNKIRTVLGKRGAAIDGQQYLPVLLKEANINKKNNRKTEEKTIDTFNSVFNCSALVE